MVWVRIDVDLAEHPVIWSLAEALGVEDVAALGFVVRLTATAARFTEDGDLGTLAPAAVARAAGWRGDAESFHHAALNSGALIEVEGRIEVFGWDAQAVLVERRRRDRDRKRAQRQGEGDDDGPGDSLGRPQDGVRTSAPTYGTDATHATDGRPPPPTQAGQAVEEVTFDQIMEAWNRAVPSAAIRIMNGKRRRLVEAAVAEHGLPGVLDLVGKVATSAFLTGKVPGSKWEGRGAAFEWAFAPDHAVRILEGEFADRVPGVAAEKAEQRTGFDPDDLDRFRDDPRWEAFADAVMSCSPETGLRFQEWLNTAEGIRATQRSKAERSRPAILAAAN